MNTPQDIGRSALRMIDARRSEIRRTNGQAKQQPKQAAQGQGQGQGQAQPGGAAHQVKSGA